ncbi:Phosphate metabolism transcription protein [Didymella pomorum]
MPSIAGNALAQSSVQQAKSAAEKLPSLSDALESLHKASQTPAKQRTVKVSGVVDTICRHAFADGLDEDALETVVHLAARKTELDQTSVTTLIKNLYPAQRVAGDVVITIVAALGQGKGKPSPGTQDSLVKWLALVHEILGDANVLSRLYGVLFGMLDMISIRLELSRGLGNEPALQGLLRVYKDYYPDIILGSASTSRKSFAPTPDVEWRERVHAIQEARTAADDPTSERHNGFKVLRQGPKRTKASVLPDVHTYHATESSVTLEGIDTVEAFIERLDRIEPPGQLISFLTDPLLQKFVDLSPSPAASARIGLWLATCLEDQITSAAQNVEDSALLAEILDGILQHARYTKTLLPVVPVFLKQYLTTWDGHENVEPVLSLLAYVPGDFFEDVYPEFLAPAERAIPVKHYYSSEVTDGLNWCLRDVYNFFWVARGLTVVEQKSVGMYCHPELRSSLDAYLSSLDRGYAIGHVFNLSYNAWLASMSSAAWHALEEQETDRQDLNRANFKAHGGTVTQQSLASLRNGGGISVDWDGAKGYKVFVLNWLAERGLGGLRELMFATVTDLKTGQDSS